MQILRVVYFILVILFVLVHLSFYLTIFRLWLTSGSQRWVDAIHAFCADAEKPILSSGQHLRFVFCFSLYVFSLFLGFFILVPSVCLACFSFWWRFLFPLPPRPVRKWTEIFSVLSNRLAVRFLIFIHSIFFPNFFVARSLALLASSFQLHNLL